MDAKRIEWMGSSKKDLLVMPEPVINTFGYALGLIINKEIDEYLRVIGNLPSYFSSINSNRLTPNRIAFNPMLEEIFCMQVKFRWQSELVRCP